MARAGVFGDSITHDRLIKELAVGSNSAVVFTDYDRAPEVKYPIAINELYTALEWVAAKGSQHGLDPKHISVAGDSVGGNMTIALTIMAKQQNGPKIEKQLLFYPCNGCVVRHSFVQTVCGRVLPAS